jgi:hypothetical protein
MTTPVRIWYRLVDAQGNQFAGARADFVYLSESVIIGDLRDAVKAKNDPILPGVVPSQLVVYEDAAALANNKALDEDMDLSNLGKAGKKKDDAVLVVVPNQYNGALVPINSPSGSELSRSYDPGPSFAPAGFTPHFRGLGYPSLTIADHLYRFSNLLEISLPKSATLRKFKETFEKERFIFVTLIECLKKKGIDHLVIDEAQRHKEFMDYIIKENKHGLRFCLVVSGTPPHGERCIEYSSSSTTRTVSVAIPTLRAYETLALLNFIFGCQVSATLWLDVWTLFVGEPLLYNFLYVVVSSKPELEKRKISSIGLVHDQDLLKRCLEQRAYHIKDTGISSEIKDEVPGPKLRLKIQKALQKEIQQLLSRDLLKFVPTIGQFLNEGQPKPNTIIWNDFFILSQHLATEDKNWLFRLRGFSFEDIFQNIFSWHLVTKTPILGLILDRHEIISLNYMGETDADLLIVERKLSDIDLQEQNELKEMKRQAYVFNLKTNPESLLGEKGAESKKKFETLCGLFSERFEVTLCFGVEDADDEKKRSILSFWCGFKTAKLHENIFVLADMMKCSPGDLEVTCRNEVLFVERRLEKTRIDALASTNPFEPNVLIQGRYRVGKSSLLQKMTQEKANWKYVELR